MSLAKASSIYILTLMLMLFNYTRKLDSSIMGHTML